MPFSVNGDRIGRSELPIPVSPSTKAVDISSITSKSEDFFFAPKCIDFARSGNRKLLQTDILAHLVRDLYRSFDLAVRSDFQDVVITANGVEAAIQGHKSSRVEFSDPIIQIGNFTEQVTCCTIIAKNMTWIYYVNCAASIHRQIYKRRFLIDHKLV